MTDTSRPCLIVCTTCRAGLPFEEGSDVQGTRLHAALRDLLGRIPDGQDAPVELREALCLASCEKGCAAAIAQPGKWTYVLGHLSPELAGDLLSYAANYAAAATGAVMPSRRPASLRHMILGRVPALDTAP